MDAVWDQLPQAIANGLLLAALYAIVALGLTLIFGVLDVVNFGHGQLVTLGAYLVYALVSGSFSFWIAVPVVMVALGLGGLLMERLTFRPVRSVPINGLLVSIGWIAILGNVISAVWGPDQYNMDRVLPGAVTFAGLTLSRSQLLVLGAGIVVMIVLSLIMRFTSGGKALRATAQNREAAALVGIRTRRLDAIAFGVGAALAALAGGLIANLFPLDPSVGDSYMVYAFVALIVGGAGSAAGAVVGSITVGLAVSLAQTFGSTGVASVAPFVVLIIVLFFRPAGLFRTDHEATL